MGGLAVGGDKPGSPGWLFPDTFLDAVTGVTSGPSAPPIHPRGFVMDSQQTPSLELNLAFAVVTMFQVIAAALGNPEGSTFYGVIL